MLLPRHQPPKAEIGGRGLTAKFVAGRVSLFDPKHAKRFGAVCDHAEIASFAHQDADQRVAVARRSGYLERKLASLKILAGTPIQTTTVADM